MQHRLNVAGARGAAIFDAEALGRLYQYTQGIPRLVNALCDRALLTGYVNESKTIGPPVIDEAAQELPSLTDQPVQAVST